MAGKWDLSGKVAVVTGASRGLGATTARLFAEAGAQVALLGRTEADLAKQVAHIGRGALPIVTNVADPVSVRDAFAKVGDAFGHLDLLVNNAGRTAHGSLEETTDEEILTVVGTNVLGPIYTTRAAIPLMRRTGGGHILNISSDGTLFPEAPYLGLYVTSKAALDMFSRVSYQELKALGIRVTLVVPGAVEAREPGPVTTSASGTDPERTSRVVQALEASGHLALLRSDGRAHYEDVVEAMLHAITAPSHCAIDLVRVRPFPTSRR
jgi:NAD(P)-dependent dehydrogenase (short-subunit alcohol dehydrogenase family)